MLILVSMAPGGVFFFFFFLEALKSPQRRSFNKGRHQGGGEKA